MNDIIRAMKERRSIRSFRPDMPDEYGKSYAAAHFLGLGSIWIHRTREEFESGAYDDLFRSLGIEGEWEGIGHCAVGYTDGEIPKPAPRKENRIYYIK